MTNSVQASSNAQGPRKMMTTTELCIKQSKGYRRPWQGQFWWGLKPFLSRAQEREEKGINRKANLSKALFFALSDF